MQEGSYLANILGTSYNIIVKPIDEDYGDGYCDCTNREIVIRSNNVNEVGDFSALQRKALRHELIHAFLSESGLQSNFQHYTEFGHDETMVDWFAIQWNKINSIFAKFGLLEEIK